MKVIAYKTEMAKRGIWILRAVMFLFWKPKKNAQPTRNHRVGLSQPRKPLVWNEKKTNHLKFPARETIRWIWNSRVSSGAKIQKTVQNVRKQRKPWAKIKMAKLFWRFSCYFAVVFVIESDENTTYNLTSGKSLYDVCIVFLFLLHANKYSV